MGQHKQGPVPLSNREKEVLTLIANGYRNEEAAKLLGLSRRTVEAHRNRIMLKLDVHDLAALAKYAIRTGLTSIDYHRED